MGEVMEERLVLEEEPVEEPPVVGTEAAEGHQQLGRRADHADRVELDAAKGTCDLEKPLRGRRRAPAGEPLGADGKAPCFPRIELNRTGRRQQVGSGLRTQPAASQRLSCRAVSGRVTR